MVVTDPFPKMVIVGSEKNYDKRTRDIGTRGGITGEREREREREKKSETLKCRQSDIVNSPWIQSFMNCNEDRALRTRKEN